MQWKCNACANTKNGVLPCVIDIPITPDRPNICPISGEKCEWETTTPVLKVYEIGGAPDWVCATSPEEAISIYKKYLSAKLCNTEIDDEIQESPPKELTDKELDDMKYTDEDTGLMIPFKQELKRRTNPELFANSQF